MSNSILTSQVRVPFLAEIESNLPVLANGTVQYNKNFVAGNGVTVDVLLPDSSVDIVDGGDLTSHLSDIKAEATSVTLVQKGFGVSVDAIENSLKLSSFVDQVAKPKGRKFASELQKLAIEKLKLGAATLKVTTTQKYTDIGEPVAAVEASRLNGDYFGVMSPKIAKGVLDSGLAFFQADLKNNFVTGNIGRYMGCDFFKTQDMGGTFSVGAYTATSPAVNQPTAYVAGATALAIDASTLSGTIVKYMAFTVAGVNAVDIHGEDSGLPYVFIAQANVTASGNAASVTILPVYASGPLKNVTALPANDAVITFLHSASKTYQSVLVWDKQAFVTASAVLKKLSNTVGVATEGKVMNLLGQQGSDIVKSLDVIRFDCLIGFALLYRNGVSRLDIEVA